MRFLYFTIRYFPYWSLPVALITAELARHFHRIRSSRNKYICISVVAFIVLLTVVWFSNRGDLNSDRWIREMALD